MAKSNLDAILNGTFKPVGSNKNNDNLNDIIKGTYTPETYVPNPASAAIPEKEKNPVVAALENSLILGGQGFFGRVESAIDWMNDWTYNKLYAGIYDLLGREDLAEQNRQSATNFIKQDLTNDIILPGANDKLYENSQVQNVVTPDSLLGQASHGVGGLFLDIAAGSLLGGGGTGALPKGASTLQKAGSFVVNNLPSMFTVGAGTYGSALQSALNEGASLEDATDYAILSSAKEMATEWIMGGVPGTNGKGIMDTLLSKTGINTIKNGIVKTLVDYGFNIVGEGFEEGLSELLEPLVKNATYTDGEKINWQNVFRSAIVGGIISGVVELPSTTSSIASEVKTNNQNKPAKEKKDIPYLKRRRQEVVDALKESDTTDVERTNQFVEVIEAIDNEIARQEKVEAIKSGEDIKVEQPKTPAKVVQEKTETKKEEVADIKVAKTKTTEKKSDEKIAAEKKVEALKTPVLEKPVLKTPVIEEDVKPTNEEIIKEFKIYTKDVDKITQKDINNFHKDKYKDISLKELTELLLPKEEPKKVEIKKKKTDDEVVAEKKVESVKKEDSVDDKIKKAFAEYMKDKNTFTEQDIYAFHKTVEKDISLKELKEKMFTARVKQADEPAKTEEKPAEIPAEKKEIPAEVTAMYDGLTPREKVVADKLIELREAYKENPNDKKVASQLKEYNAMQTKKIRDYLFARNKALIDFKKVDKDVVEQQTQKAFEEPPTNSEKLSNASTTESYVPDLDSMSKNDLFDYAKQQYESYIQSGIPSIREKALKYYKAYKDAGGKKNIATLDEYLNDIEKETSVVEEEPVIEETVVEEEPVIEEPKTLEEYNKSRPKSSLEDAYGDMKRVVEYSVEPVSDFNGKLRSDVTLDELNNSMVKLQMFNSDGTRNEYTYANKKELFDDIKKSYGGWKQLGDAPRSIVSTQGEFYLERDRHVKGGWKWIDVNGDPIKGQETADIGQRNRAMLEKLRAETEATKEVPEVTVETLEETPVEEPTPIEEPPVEEPVKEVNIPEEIEQDVLVARIVGGELVSMEKQLSTYAERFKNTVKEEELLSEDLIIEIDKAYLYDVAHNADTMNKAKDKIDEIGFNEAKKKVMNLSEIDVLDLETTALGQELLQQAIHNEDVKSINELLPIVTMQLTKAGQIVQSAKMYHLLSGEQRLITIQKTINTMKKNKVKGAEDMIITSSMVDKILKAGNDRVALDKAVEEITQELGSNLKGSVRDKFNAVRYFSMLNNLTTHINNASNNFVNRNVLKRSKDIIGSVIESGVRKFAPDTFKDTVKSENEVYVTIQDKQRLAETKKDIAKLDKGIEFKDYKNSLVLRKEKERVINRLKGQVKMNEIHNEINSIWKELNYLDKQIKQGSEIRIEDGQQSVDLNSMQNKKHELIKIKDRLEAKLPKSYSTKTLHRSSKDVKEFTDIYLRKNKDALKNRSKTKLSSDIQSMKSIFGKNAVDANVKESFENGDIKGAVKQIANNLGAKGDKKVLETIGNIVETRMQLNSYMLDFADNVAKSKTFKMSFASAATVNGLDAKIQKIKESSEYKALNEDAKADYLYSKLNKENAEMLMEIYEYSLNEAFEVTAQQANSLANIINELKKVKGKTNSQLLESAISFAVDSYTPFTNTLFNTAENALKYSPVGLMDTVTRGLNKMKNGKITPSTFINELSKGLTGTMVFGIGYLLRSLNLLSGDDEEEPYAFKIGDTYIGLDRFDNAAIPLFFGSRMYDILTAEDMKTGDAIWSMTKPFVDMTFLSTFDDVLTDYKYGGPMEVIGEMVSNYVLQYIPSKGSKLNKILDNKERQVYPDSDDPHPFWTKLWNQTLNRIPFGYKFLPEKMNEWGETKERDGNIIVRIFDEFIYPGRIVQGTENSIPELSALQEATGESGLVPSKFDGTIEYDGKKYEATPEEKRQYQKTYGSKSLEAVNEFINSDEYKNLTDEQRIKAIKTIYTGTREIAKQEFFDNRGEYYETSASWINEIEDEGISIAEYATFKSKIDDSNSDTKFKSTVSAVKDYNGSNKQKAYLYGKVYSNTDETNTVIVNSGISFDAYLDYKGRTKDLKADPNPNSNIAGATISGSKKKKVLKEIANTPGLSKEQKLLLTYLAGYAINNGDYVGISKNGARQTVFKYVDGLNLSVQEKRDILDKAGYKILKNGNISW
jgi:hypothetical protein